MHRSAHALASRATIAFESARDDVTHFLNAAHREEIIWTRGTTEAINLVAYAWGLAYLQQGDEILISAMEHHANLVPWQQVALKTGARLRIIPLQENGDLDLFQYRQMLSDKTRLVAVTQVSNVLGTVNPVKEIVRLAHEAGALTLIDGAQAVAHNHIDVQALDCDFYVFSGHKVYGPTGIGVLYGKQALLNTLDPWQFGGEMIERVTYESSTFNRPPFRFEAGTPPIAEAIGLAAALKFIREQMAKGSERYHQQLLQQLVNGLTAIEGVHIIGNPVTRQGVVSISLPQFHHHDVCQFLDAQGVAVRSGHHCAMPLIEALGLSGTLRISPGIYNIDQEIMLFLSHLQQTMELLDV